MSDFINRACSIVTVAIYKIVHSKKNNDMYFVNEKNPNAHYIEDYNLPKLDKFEDILCLLLYTREQINDFIKNKENHYVSFRIPQKNSIKKRFINAPKYRLKMAQRIILSEIIEKFPCSNYATAFLKNKNGLYENAKAHKNQLFLLKVDFKDFFQSIKTKKVENIFYNIGYSETVIKILTTLCTFHDELPQGAVTSPYLSNLACIDLDKDISNYCNERNICYTRYADDLIFSSNDLDLLNELKYNINNILKKHRTNNFQIEINSSKTKIIKNTSHKKITGITINDFQIKASKKIKNKIRQSLRYCLKNGVFDNSLIGNLAYVISIEKEDYKKRIYNYALFLESKLAISNSEILTTILKMTKT